MPKAKDISHLSQRDQEKILAKRARDLAYSRNNAEAGRIRSRAWNAANPERKAAAGLKWASENSERKAELDSIWGKANRPKMNEAFHRHVNVNPELYRAKRRVWQDANKDTLNAKRRKHLATNVNRKLADNLRSRTSAAMRRGTKSGSAVRDLGCTIAELKTYLEAQFTEGMSWETYGRTGFHIDHITPLASFDLTDRDQFLKAVHFTNLQPLWAKDNLRKGDKMVLNGAPVRGRDRVPVEPMSADNDNNR